MTQKQHQRQLSNFTFHSKQQKNKQKAPSIAQINDSNLDYNYFFTMGSLQEEFQQFQKQYQYEYEKSSKKSFAPIKKEQLQKVFKYFKKYQPIYFSKYVIKQMSYKFKKGVYIKKYKQGYYFGEILQIQTQEKSLLKIKHGKGVFVYNLFDKKQNQIKRIYQGQWRHDKKHGLGFQKFIDGSVFHGNYLDNKPQGRGKFTNSKGQIYEGQWKNGIKQGKGFWQGINGETYMGQWKNGQPQGYGVFVNLNGNRYEGQYKNAMKFGQGIQRFANGDLYKGSFQNDKPGGYGEYYWKNKSYFKGYFSNGLRTGQGLWKKGAGNCDKYEGQYQHDKKWGYGIFTWSNGNVFKGNYEGDLRNGYGQMYWNNGSYYKGHWKDGVQHGKGQLYVVGQGLRIGLFQNNQIIDTQFEQPDLDTLNQQNLNSKANNYSKKLLRDLSKTSNLSVKSKNSKYSGMSKQKTMINEKRNHMSLKSRPSQTSLINQAKNERERFFSQNQNNIMKSVPLNKLVKHKQISQRYLPKGNGQKQTEFRITQIGNYSKKMNQSLNNSRVSKTSIQQKRKNRILHSSFYLHKFKKLKSPQKQMSNDKRNIYPY